MIIFVYIYTRKETQMIIIIIFLCVRDKRAERKNNNDITWTLQHKNNNAVNSKYINRIYNTHYMGIGN